MRRISVLIAVTLSVAPRGRQESFESLARASLARIDGQQPIPGLRDSVQIIRDRWGVPHIYARNLDDLFFAQGFVQAQDRLWQRDMYRRTWSGELAEILGPTYVAHDRLARLLKYRGPWDDREWTSYHPDGKRILDAFARGGGRMLRDSLGTDPSGWRWGRLHRSELPHSLVRTTSPQSNARVDLRLWRRPALPTAK